MVPKIDLERVLSETRVARAEHHAELASTNDLARLRAMEGTGPLPLLVLADRQTAGRGRGPNRWWTGPGSLAMSLLMDAPSSGEASASPRVGLASAAAVVRTVKPLLPGIEVGLHWPNDVFAARRKLAGSLVEVLAGARRKGGGLPAGGPRIILGIGVNTNNTLADAPPELQERATTLRDLTGRSHDPTGLLIDLLRHLEVGIALLKSSPDELGREADRLCLQRGRRLTVRAGRVETTGRCEGIAPDGALLLATADGQKRVYTGTVSEDP